MPEAHPVKNDVIEPVAPARSRVVKKASKKRRKLVTRDISNQSATRALRRAGALAPFSTYVSHTPTTPTNTHTHTHHIGKRGEEIDEALEALKPTRWRDLSYVGRSIAYNRVIVAGGNPIAFSLNLNPDLVARAIASSKGLKKTLAERIKDELRKVLPSDIPCEFIFVLGIDDDGRWHLHGSISVRPAYRKHVLGALKRAGGGWKHTKGSQFQCRLKVERNPDGWARYCYRHIPAALKAFGRDPVFASNAVRRRACELHEAERAEIKNLKAAREAHRRAAAPKATTPPRRAKRLPAATPRPLRMYLVEGIRGAGLAPIYPHFPDIWAAQPQ